MSRRRCRRQAPSAKRSVSTVDQAAQGILDIVNENMAGALRLVSVQRGYDPRDFALVAFGGAGPLHANAVAKLMGSYPVSSRRVRVCSAPRATWSPTSARSSRARSSVRPRDVGQVPRGPRDSHCEKLGKEAMAWIEREGIEADIDRRKLTYNVDLRYYRQGYEIPVEVKLEATSKRGNGMAAGARASTKLHEQFYGFRMDGTACEIVNLRAVGIGKRAGAEDEEVARRRRRRKPRTASAVGAWSTNASTSMGKWIPVQDLRPGQARPPATSIEGPGGHHRVRLHHSSFCAGYTAEIDRYLNILINPNRRAGRKLRLMKGVKIAEIPEDRRSTPVTLDIIEGALKNARHEMDAVLFRTAMSPVIREQHDEFPMITDPQGSHGRRPVRLVHLRDDGRPTTTPSKRATSILTSDPYKCGGAISHVNDWLICVPIFFDGELVGWSSMFGHQMDAGGPLPGSLPTGAKTIFGEGLRIPPVKVFKRASPSTTSST